MTRAETIELSGGPVDGTQIAVQGSPMVWIMIQPRPITFDYDVTEPTAAIPEPIELQWIDRGRRNREGRRVFEWKPPTASPATSEQSSE